MGALHCRTRSSRAREIYLPYICHVPNCITRYVGFLYKTALRSHRLCCHRSICRSPSSRVCLTLSHTPATIIPLYPRRPLALSPSPPLLRESLSRATHTHTEKYLALHSRTIWFAALPFIHNTPGSKSSTPHSMRAALNGQSGAKRRRHAEALLRSKGIFRNEP